MISIVYIYSEMVSDNPSDPSFVRQRDVYLVKLRLVTTVMSRYGLSGGTSLVLQLCALQVSTKHSAYETDILNVFRDLKA